MTNIELLNYQIEYETTDITIPDLCEKYSLQEKKLLKHSSTWTKRINLPTNLEETNDEIKGEVISTQAVPALQDSINLFKEKAVTYALTSIEDPQYLEIKEFKDLVAIVDMVEKSINKNDAPQVSVFIQNLTQQFAKFEDC